jgi:hypothetical protein
VEPTDTFGSVPLHASQGTTQLLRFNADPAYLPLLSWQSPSIPDFAFPGKHPSVYLQGKKYTCSGINKSVVKQKTNIACIIQEFGCLTEYQEKEQLNCSRRFLCVETSTKAVVHRLGMVACSSSVFTV